MMSKSTDSRAVGQILCLPSLQNTAKISSLQGMLTAFTCQAASIPLLATVAGLCIVQETLPVERRRSLLALLCMRKKAGQESPTINDIQRREPLRAMFTKPVCFMLLLWGLYIVSMLLSFDACHEVRSLTQPISFKQFMAMTGTVAEVLFLSSPVNVGGLDLAPREMALLYTARPVIGSAANLLIYPFLAHRYRTEAIFRWSVTLNNTTYFALYFAFGLYVTASHASHAVSLALLLLLSLPACLNASTATACTHALTSRAPSKSYLARITTAQEYVSNTAHGLGSRF